LHSKIARDFLEFLAKRLSSTHVTLYQHHSLSLTLRRHGGTFLMKKEELEMSMDRDWRIFASFNGSSVTQWHRPEDGSLSMWPPTQVNDKPRGSIFAAYQNCAKMPDNKQVYILPSPSLYPVPLPPTQALAQGYCGGHGLAACCVA
jgi:hypothetical protein